MCIRVASLRVTTLKGNTNECKLAVNRYERYPNPSVARRYSCFSTYLYTSIGTLGETSRRGIKIGVLTFVSRNDLDDKDSSSTFTGKKNSFLRYTPCLYRSYTIDFIVRSNLKIILLNARLPTML